MINKNGVYEYQIINHIFHVLKELLKSINRKDNSHLIETDAYNLRFVLLQVATGVVFLVTAFLITYTFHCTWVTSEAYSSPSIVLSARAGDGGRIIFDDFREAYYWLRHNTPEVEDHWENSKPRVELYCSKYVNLYEKSLTL